MGVCSCSHSSAAGLSSDIEVNGARGDLFEKSTVQPFEAEINSRTADLIDVRLSRPLLLADARAGLKQLEQLGPFALADETKHLWRPKMFEKSNSRANIKPGNKGGGYSITREVRWYVKIKEGYVPQCLLECGVFAKTDVKDGDGDSAFELVESPQYPVTLEKDAKKICNIPLQADQFSFIYPVDEGVLDKAAVETALKRPDAADVSANLELLNVGAFVYWRGQSAFPALALRPLRLAEVGLSFSMPRDISLLDGSGELASLLSWHEVTLEPLRQLGVRSFTWINPNRPDLLPHLNYFHVRHDEEMALPPGNSIRLENVHLIGSQGDQTPLWTAGQSLESLQVQDAQGSRASPKVVHAFSKYNLRDFRNAHFYQFAEHGAFAYRMENGSIRYFDVIDSFVRPMAVDLASTVKLQNSPEYQKVCNRVMHAREPCVGLLNSSSRPATWAGTANQWRKMTEALDAVEEYESMLTKYFEQETNPAAKLDAQQIAQLCNARRDDIWALDDLLAPRPPTRMSELGPIALRSCAWNSSHMQLLFDGQVSAEAAVSSFEQLISSFTEIPVHITSVPRSMILPELRLTDTNTSDDAAKLKTRLSPVAAVSLPLLSRTKAGIPLAATHFAFLYPVDDPRVQAAQTSASFKMAQHGLELSLLSTGGFIYLDEKGRIVEDGVKALKFGVEGLRFAPARDLDAFAAAAKGCAVAGGFREFVEEKPIEALDKQCRWHTVTARELRNMQVSHFLWLPPPTLGQPSPLPGVRHDLVRLADHSNHAPYILGVHGCFAYKCQEDSTNRTVYFDVLPDPSAALYAQLEQMEGFKGISELVGDLKKRLLGVTNDREPKPVLSTPLATCIQAETGKSRQAVHLMLAEYIRAIANLQMDRCSVCQEGYGVRRPRKTFRVCKHTICEECELRLRKCPLCNVSRAEPKLADEWLQLLDKQEELAGYLQVNTVNIAELWWQQV